MQNELIGSDGWACCGHVLTPAMRENILAAAADLYASWSAADVSYEWDRDERRLVQIDPHEVATLEDFFGELTGDRFAFDGTEFPDHSCVFYEWLKEYVVESWGDGVYEEDEGGNDPMNEAEQRVFEWLGPLRVEDVSAWHAAEVTS